MTGDLYDYLKETTKGVLTILDDTLRFHNEYVKSGEYTNMQIALNYMAVTRAENKVKSIISQSIINYYFKQLRRGKTVD